MSDPRFTVDRRVGAPPDAVAAALRDALAAACREDLPPPLRKRVRGLTGKVRDDRFSVHFDDRSEGETLDLDGWLLPSPGGECRVHARASDDRHTGAVVVGLLAVAAVFWGTGGEGAGWIVGFAAFLGLVALVRQAGGYIDEARADFLVAWLHGVLDGLADSSAVAPPHSGVDAVSSP